MHTRPFGPTGLQVSAIGMGAMPLSTKSDRPSEPDAIAVIHHAVDCGVTLFDTADSYCRDDKEVGHNERLIGKALGQIPSSARYELVVATKGGFVRPGGRWEHDGRPEHLRQVCEQSLKNLDIDQITVYQLHTPDASVPLADSLGELKRLQDEGKIRHIGVSNFSVEQLDQAQQLVEVVSIQNHYSPKYRQPEKDGTLAASQQRGLAFLPWSPLGGVGSAKRLGQNEPTVKNIAVDHGVSVHRVALAWLLNKGPTVIPIPGVGQKASIEDSAKAADLELADDEIECLDEAWL